MKPEKLILRCLAEKKHGQWQALCLDLCLAAQADSLDEAKQKLEGMILEYVYDALAGEDKQYAGQLLSRRAPAKDWAKYYVYSLLAHMGQLHNDVRQLFTEALPLQPINHRHA